MRRPRRLAFIALATVAGALCLTPSVAHGADPEPAFVTRCPTEGSVPGQSSPGPPLQKYFKDDWRLGPKHFPESGRIGEMLETYRRFRGSGSEAFLDCYWHSGFAPGWFFPNENGFLITFGNPFLAEVTLTVGEKVDLFGSGQGRFLAPAGTPYEQRGIPPSNLNTFVEEFKFSYHRYRVTAPFPVQAGLIASWFNQPGLGVQFFTGNTVAPNLPPNPRIPDLVGNGYLVELT